MHRRHLLAASMGAVLPWHATAQTGGTIRLVVPFTPGGSTDILARAIGPKLALALGQTVVIENKPGAGGSLGAGEVAKADPDGRTLLMGHIGTLAVNPAIYPRLSYDPLKSFAPVSWVARVPNVLVVPAGSPARSFKEFIDRARLQPGRLSYSSGGNGSAAHITFEYLKLVTRIFMLHIPYRGTAPSVTDLIAGQVDATFTGAPAVLPHVRSGRLRALALSSPHSASRRCRTFRPWPRAVTPASRPTSGTAWWRRRARPRRWWRASTRKSTRPWPCRKWRSSWRWKARCRHQRHRRRFEN